MDQPFTHEAEEEIRGSYDDNEHMFMWHRFDLSSYLQESDENFQTGETGNGSMQEVVFCGITTLEGEGEQNLNKDYWANGLRPSITLPRPLWFCWTMWAACGTLTK